MTDEAKKIREQMVRENRVPPNQPTSVALSELVRTRY